MTELATAPRLDQLRVGGDLPELRKDPITKLQLVKYAGASGDFNLIHTDDETAKAVGLDGVIAHGMLSMAFLGQYCCWLAGPESVRRLTVRFAEMVRPGDVLTCRGRVKSREEHETERRLTIEIWAENQRAQPVTTGEAELLVQLPSPLLEGGASGRGVAPA
ncbi:MAG TPA: MaoC/PaaZ C-terminal domain-containing protein [Candidatus Dormibacteraeota bacterium]